MQVMVPWLAKLQWTNSNPASRQLGIWWSTIRIRRFFTVPLLDPVSPMVWLGWSIRYVLLYAVLRQLLMAQNASVSLETQRTEAKASQFMLNPGEKFPDEANPSTSSVSSITASSTSRSQTSTATADSSSQTAAPAAASHSKLPTGAIVGIAVGGALVALLLGALFFLLGRQTTMLQFMRRHQQPPNPHSIAPVAHVDPISPTAYGGNTPTYPAKYGTQVNAAELGSDTATYPPGSPALASTRATSTYSDPYEEYRRQKSSPPLETHLESPQPIRYVYHPPPHTFAFIESRWFRIVQIFRRDKPIYLL